MTDRNPLILLVSGPNLDTLGKRQPEIYGTLTLKDYEDLVREKAAELSIDVICFQSNSEGEISDFLRDNADRADGVIINPAALSHYSHGLAGRLKSLSCPVVEVHITNLYKREEWRQKSVTASSCDGVIMGLGKHGYHAALMYLIEKMRESGKLKR